MDNIQKCLKRLLGKKENREKYYTAWLQAHWKELIGLQLAQKSFPEKIIKDTLFLAVTNSTWAHNFLIMKKEILENLKNAPIDLVKIKELKISVKTKRNSQEQGEEEIFFWEPELDEPENVEINTRLASIRNNELHDQVKASLIKDKKRKKYLLQAGFSCCVKCGVPLAYKAKKCAVCEKEEKNYLKKLLYNLFREAPWISFNQAKEQLPLERALFFQTKEECERHFLRQALAKNAYNTDITCYVMLKTGCKVTELTEELIQRTMLAAGRKKLVFVSGS